MPETHYNILGISKNASRAEVEHAYRMMVRSCHPDLNPGDAAARGRFQEVQAAFDVLYNIESRRRYDQSFDTDHMQREKQLSELFEDRTVGKLGNPIVSFTDETDLDNLRFGERAPGTQLRLYRPRNRLFLLQDWLMSSDFVLPLLLLLVLIGLHVAGTVWDMLSGRF